MDTYELVTKRIIERMEQGVIPWQRPWICKEDETKVTKATATKYAFNRITKRIYSNSNQWLLSKVGEYATFAQWSNLGGKINKGAKAEIVIFWKWLEEVVKDTDDDGNEVEKIRRTPLLRYYQVFHISDVSGVEPLELSDSEESETQFSPIETAESLMTTYIEREDIGFGYGGNQAFYSPTFDSITIPQRFKFETRQAEFYSTVFHEMAHSTGHATRLDRLSHTAHFGNEEYSKEELVAEISSASILATLEIETKETFTNSTAYLQSWIKALQNDKRLFVIASAQADKAVNYIFNGKDQETTEAV